MFQLCMDGEIEPMLLLDYPHFPCKFSPFVRYKKEFKKILRNSPLADIYTRESIKGKIVHTADIISSINLKIFRGPIQMWQIGITNDPVERKRYWTEVRKENTDHWSYWETESLWEAQDIESLFISMGMKNRVEGDRLVEGVVYVYIF